MYIYFIFSFCKSLAIAKLEGFFLKKSFVEVMTLFYLFYFWCRQAVSNSNICNIVINAPKLSNKIHLLEISKTFLRTLQGSISLIGEFPSHFDLKNMILTNTKDFSPKKWPNFARFQRKKVPNLQILMFSSSR